MPSVSTEPRSHNKFFEVVNTKIVKAPNMAEAQRLSRLSRSSNILGEDTLVTRITADEARDLISEA
jgi:hypothetical protein